MIPPWKLPISFWKPAESVCEKAAKQIDLSGPELTLRDVYGYTHKGKRVLICRDHISDEGAKDALTTIMNRRTSGLRLVRINSTVIDLDAWAAIQMLPSPYGDGE